MPLPQSQLPHFPVQALTLAFHIQGAIEPIGPIIDYLNDANRLYVPFVDATISPLTPGPMGNMTRSQLVVPKNDITLLYLDDAAARSTVRLMKRAEKCIAYMPSLVCRAEFHLGAETRWQDMLGLIAGDFFGVSSATIFPLVTLPAPFPQQAELLILNRLRVQMLHPEQT